MNPYKFLKGIFETRGPFSKKSKDSDFSSFIVESPTRMQLLIEKCKKQDVSIYCDDSSEQSVSIFRGVASEAELERRLNAKKQLHFTLISLFAIIVPDIVKLFSWGIQLFT